MNNPTGDDIQQTVLQQTVDYRPDQAKKTPGNLSTEQGGRQPTRVIGDYEVLEELGRGSMGVVYKAVHRKLKRTVALKMILAGSHAGREELVRFRLEAEAIARLQHPHIVQIFEIGEDGTTPFFALEFIDGGSLARFRGTPVPPRQAAELVAVLAQAMHVAHQAGIIHRDLKPANILLSKKSPSANDNAPPQSGAVSDTRLELGDFDPKITDFGLAKQLDGTEDLSSTGAIMGTPPYMAPEQAWGRSRDIGPCSDVYALAAILYDLLTGRPPFKGASMMETIQVRTLEPVPPTRLQPKVPRDLEIICLKGLRKDSRQRYASASDLAKDLHRFLDGKPILGRPVPAWERAWKWARREPAKAAAVLAVILALIGGAAGMLFYGLYNEQRAVRAKQQGDRERKAREEIDELDRSAELAAQAANYEEAWQKWDKALMIRDREPGAGGEELRRRLLENLEGMQKTIGDQKREKEREVQRQQKEREREVEKQKAAKDLALRQQRVGKHLDNVLYYAVSVKPQDEARNGAMIRREARAALVEMQATAGDRPEELGPLLARLQPHVEAQDLKKLANDCYLLLLWLAVAETRSPLQPDQAPKLEFALQALDAAGALAKAYDLEPTRAFHLARADCLAKLRDEATAARERERALDIPLTATVDLLAEALQSIRAGKSERAAVLCGQMLGKDPNYFWPQYLLALCSVKVRSWPEALTRLDGCVARQPNAPWLLMQRAVVKTQLKDKDYAGAEADYGKAHALLKETNDSALMAELLINRSSLWTAQQKWENAENDLREASRLEPEAYLINVQLASVYWQQKTPDKQQQAVAEMGKAIARRPGNPDLYRFRAFYRADRDRPGARKDLMEYFELTKGAKMTETMARARLKLAELCQLDKEYVVAIGHCDAVLDVWPNYQPAHVQRADLLRELGRWREAGLALDCYFAVGGASKLEVCRVRGLIHMHFREYESAVEMFSRALMQKRETALLTERGWAYLELQAPRPGLADFQEALRMDKANIDALTGRGKALVLLGRAAEAVDDAATALKAARNKDRMDARMRLRIAAIYARAVGVLESGRKAQRISPEEYAAQETALALVREALQSVRQGDPRDYWDSSFRYNADFLPLHGTAGWLDLIGQYQRKDSVKVPMP